MFQDEQVKCPYRALALSHFLTVIFLATELTNDGTVATIFTSYLKAQIDVNVEIMYAIVKKASQRLLNPKIQLIDVTENKKALSIVQTYSCHTDLPVLQIQHYILSYSQLIDKLEEEGIEKVEEEIFKAMSELQQ